MDAPQADSRSINLTSTRAVLVTLAAVLATTIAGGLTALIDYLLIRDPNAPLPAFATRCTALLLPHIVALGCLVLAVRYATTVPDSAPRATPPYALALAIAFAFVAAASALSFTPLRRLSQDTVWAREGFLLAQWIGDANVIAFITSFLYHCVMIVTFLYVASRWWAQRRGVNATGRTS